MNISRCRFPLEDARMADFMAALERINALGDASPGFVWRLRDHSGNATAVRPYADPLIIINLTVWQDIASLRAFTYRSGHGQIFRRRHEWFDDRGFAMWWIPAGTLPSVDEAVERLGHLTEHGPSPFAFGFATATEPMAHSGAGPMAHSGAGPMAHSGGPMAHSGAGPMAHSGAGPMAHSLDARPAP